MGCCSDVRKPVFVKTNLGTRLAAVPISPDITANEFKRELERTHLNCFPELGRIRVNSLMVKQKSCFYHLSESLPLKYAFPDSSEGTWFLQMDAQSQCAPNPANNISVELRDSLIHTDKKRTKHKRKRVGIWSFSFLKAALLRTPEEERRRKKRKGNRKRRAEINQTKMDVTADSRNETLSESVSISGIINKYFSDYDEVASNTFGTARSRHECKKYLNRRRRSSEYKYAKPEVGNRLLLASDNLGLSPSNQQPALSLRKSPFCKSADVVRNLVFEMAEGSD
ncbi:hypothetical protein OROGR_015057 [Orobanche gracilis]